MFPGVGVGVRGDGVGVDWGVVSGGRFVGEMERKKVVGRRLDMLERVTILPGSPLGASPSDGGRIALRCGKFFEK